MAPYAPKDEHPLPLRETSSENAARNHLDTRQWTISGAPCADCGSGFESCRFRFIDCGDVSKGDGCCFSMGRSHLLRGASLVALSVSAPGVCLTSTISGPQQIHRRAHHADGDGQHGVQYLHRRDTGWMGCRVHGLGDSARRCYQQALGIWPPQTVLMQRSSERCAA